MSTGNGHGHHWVFLENGEFSETVGPATGTAVG